MIRLTKAGEYAVRAVLYLSAQPLGTIHDRETVARAQDIPTSFLSKILQRLTAAGIVRSYKGVAGGFSLAKPSGEITMLEVVRVVEGPLALNQCLIGTNGCDNKSFCPVHPIWQKAQAALEELLRDVTFAQLAAGLDGQSFSDIKPEKY